MSFLGAARAALPGQSDLPRFTAAIILCSLLAGFSISCGSSSSINKPDHSAYVTLPSQGRLALLHINGRSGAITVGALTAQILGTTPTALALLPSRKFLYAVNSFDNSISIFSIGIDGTLTLSGVPVPVGGSGPVAAVIDPSGTYLLVTNNFTNNISVFSINSSTGALSLFGSPAPANTSPSEILFTHSGKFVYVTNPSLGAVSGFSFSNGVLTPLPNSPVPSGSGAYGLAVDTSDQYLYVTNPAANNPLVPTIGNISGFNINQTTGVLSPILGSPFTVSNGVGPTEIAVDPSGRFVYAVTTGSSNSIWCFVIDSTNGQLTPVTGSPFSLAAGELFAIFDPSGGYFYIGSQEGNGIDGYTYNPSTGAPAAIAGSPFSTVTAPGKMVFSE